MRRWLRRQDRFTRGLMVATAALSVLVAALILPRLSGAPKRRPAAEAVAPAVKAQAVTARRAPGDGGAKGRSRLSAPAPSSPKTPPAAPRVAIVIDDLGQNFSHFEQLADLGIPLSIAVIPGLPATARTVREASRRGIELLLHQPMEPREEGGKPAGEGFLLTSMTAQAIGDRVRASLAAVPGAVGVNNHMGSRFTEDADGLGALMVVLREHDLFWLDSRTTAATRGGEVARSFGVPAIERDVFLDAEASVEFIRRQLRRLVETARRHGAAVGIGHPHVETLAVLREMRAELLDAGVDLVPVSALLRPSPPPGSAPPLISSIPRARRAADSTGRQANP